MPSIPPRPTPSSSLGAACLFGLLLTGSPAAGQEDVFTFQEIGPGIYASVTVETVHPSSFANAIAVVGSEGVLLVDTQQSPSAGRDLLEAIAHHTDRPVRWVVNTHWHGDHVWGNAAVREAWPDAAILGHPVTRDSLTPGATRQVAAERERLSGLRDRIRAAFDEGRVPEDQRARYTSILDRTEAQLRELEGLEVVPPREVVPDERRIDLGGREVLVLHPGPAHTRGDLVVWVPDAGFLAAGDLLEEAPLWLEGADVQGWSRALTALEALEPRQVLPAHGRLRDGAGLLHAHAGFLRDAVERAGRTPPPDSAALVEALAPHRAALASWGVEGEAFEGYVASVRAALEAGASGESPGEGR